MFGGNNLKAKFNDLWKFSLKNHKWQEVITDGNIPNSRSGHTMNFYKGLLVIFGGIESVTQEKNDFFTCNVMKKQ